MKKEIGLIIGTILAVSTIFGSISFLSWAVSYTNYATEMIENPGVDNTDVMINETVNEFVNPEMITSAVYWSIILTACSAFGIKVKSAL